MIQEFRLKNINETRHYFLEETEQHELISKKHKNDCTTLNYIEDVLILASTIIECISVSSFASSFGIPTGITSSAIRLKICAIAAGIKMYKPIIRKKKKKHDKIVLLAKYKLNNIEVLISKALVDSNIIYGEFVLINDALKEHYNMKEEIKNLKTLSSLSKILVYLQNNVIVLF